jgi:MFS family permease
MPAVPIAARLTLFVGPGCWRPAGYGEAERQGLTLEQHLHTVCAEVAPGVKMKQDRAETAEIEGQGIASAVAGPCRLARAVHGARSAGERAALPGSSVNSRLYGAQFWMAYLANFLLVCANALVFRFADFVSFLGGTEASAGLAVGLGTAVGVPIRLYLGRIIDQRGTRLIWVSSALLFAAGAAWFLWLQSVGPWLYLARICYWCGLAGTFSCGVVYICTGIPAQRRAELIGTWGTSGFIGLVAGPHLGDLIFSQFGNSRLAYDTMFATASLLGLCLAAVVWLMPGQQSGNGVREKQSIWRLLARYWPGWVAAAAVMMGVSMVVWGTYLTRYREYRGLSGLGEFFTAYTLTALVVRVCGRRLPERFGRRRLTRLGLTAMAASMILYLPVRETWHLLAPAIAGGFAHGLLFPCVTALGTEAFPERHRATGTTLVMALVDLGMVCAAPLLGAIIVYLGFEPAFLSVAVVLLLVAAYPAVSIRRPAQ